MPAFLHRSRVAFHETDAAGVVYFANYFRFAEEAETSALASCGFKPNGCHCMRVHAEADYRQPLHFWDPYNIEASLEHIGNSSLHWLFNISGPAGPCATVRYITARRTPQNKPAPYSATERSALLRLLKEPDNGFFQKK